MSSGSPDAGRRRRRRRSRGRCAPRGWTPRRRHRRGAQGIPRAASVKALPVCARRPVRSRRCRDAFQWETSRATARPRPTRKAQRFFLGHDAARASAGELQSATEIPYWMSSRYSACSKPSMRTSLTSRDRGSARRKCRAARSPESRRVALDRPTLLTAQSIPIAPGFPRPVSSEIGEIVAERLAAARLVVAGLPERSVVNTPRGPPRPHARAWSEKPEHRSLRLSPRMHMRPPSALRVPEDDALVDHRRRSGRTARHSIEISNRPLIAARRPAVVGRRRTGWVTSSTVPSGYPRQPRPMRQPRQPRWRNPSCTIPSSS